MEKIIDAYVWLYYHAMTCDECQKRTNLGGNGLKELREAGASKVAVVGRKVSATVDGLEFRSKPDTHRPATATTEGLHVQGGSAPPPHTAYTLATPSKW